MMQISKKQHSELLDALNFPKKGEVLGGKPVLSASAKLSGDVLTYEVEFPKGTKTKEIPSLLKHFFSTQVIPTETNMVVKHHDYRVHPKNGNVCVSGAMSIGEVVRSNPTMLEFDQEYADMEMTNPETYFKKHDYGTFNSPQFRAKLFGFVSYMGENYGYCDDKCIYHRRASLIMPKIKITKAVPKAKMMYHTHPKKDEPSLSSADDYLIYMDLSHEPRGIRHFYTVMEDRMDHFQITPKKDSKSKFVQLSEDKIIEEIDTKITDLEHKWNEKIPKENSSKEDDLRYCENVTRDLVSWMNKKYGKYFTFKYNCYYRVKKNPPEPSADDLHLNDEFLQKAIADIRTRAYSWPEFESKKMPHELYAYWHQMYYKKFAQSSSMTLGVNLAPANQRRYDQYMSKKFEDTLYSNLDALHVLNLAYDIAAQDTKVRDGNEFASRMEELCKYLGISDQACETLTLLEQIIHQQEVFSEEAKTMAGDYYPLVLLSFYSISAINTIEKVKEGKIDPDLAKYEVYAKLKTQVGGELESFLITKERLPYNGFVDSYLNPPPMILKRTDYLVTFPPEAFDFYDIVVEALGQYSKSLVDPRKEFQKLGKFNLSVPTSGGRVGMMITQSTGQAQVFATNTKNPMEDAMEAVDKVGQALYRAGLPVDPKEFNLTFDEPATNPQLAQVIAICGPSGSGKSTTIRTLLKQLPNSRTSATVTTRRKRKSDKPGEKEHLSKGEFLHLVERGELVAVQLQKSGDYYGRRRSDFEKEGYVIIDVSLTGYDQIKKIFPNTFGVYLEPVEDPETIRKRLLRRGDMSAKDARGRASIIPQHIQDSKSRNFDLRIQTKSGEFDYAAKEILDTLPRVNPQETLPPELTEGAAVSPIPATEWFKKPLVPSPQERPEDTSTQSSLFEYFEEDENEDQELEEAIEEIPENPKRSNKKELFDWFEEWVHLVNMKNKELKAFLDSDWGKVAGLSKQEAKDWNNIKSGRVSGRRILSMRKKIGLTGPKDYIDPNKPRILEDYYEKALNNWTGPSDDAMKGETDWDWCKRQVRFNKRASAFPYNPTAEEAKGPLVKEFKTYNRPSRRLLSLWVWGHDPWRWARKHGMEKMSPCPDVPWIGMTEKRKWGKVNVEMKPRKNPSFGQLTYTRASKDTRSLKDRILKPRDDFVGHATRPEFGYAFHKKGPFGKDKIDRSIIRKQIRKDTALSKKRGDPYSGTHTSFTIGSGAERYSRGVNLVPAVLGKDSLSRMANWISWAKENAVHEEIIPFLQLAASGETLIHDDGEYISLMHRDADNIREAMYLLYHQKTTDHEFAHQAEISGKGDHEEDLGLIDNFDIGAETIAMTIESAYQYVTFARVDSLNAVVAFALHRNSLYASEVQPAKYENYTSYNLAIVPYYPTKGQTLSQLMGEVRLEYSQNSNILVNPRIPKKYEGQDPSEHSDLYTDEDPKGTIQGLGFKDKATAEKSVNIIKRSGKTHAHKIQAAMAMEQRARFHPNATPGIKAAQKVYAKFIEEMKEKTKRNPKKTPEGRKIPKRYLKGLNQEEMIIAAKEIDKGYKYDINDPKAYEFWKSDIKATARGYETVPSKYKAKFIEMYGPLPKEGDFITKMSKATGVRKPILQKVYDKGLAAWRGGHRPGVQQHQWASGRVYSFVTLGNTVKKGNKKMPDYKLAVEAGLVKENPSEWRHGEFAEEDPFEEYF